MTGAAAPEGEQRYCYLCGTGFMWYPGDSKRRKLCKDSCAVKLHRYKKQGLTLEEARAKARGALVAPVTRPCVVCDTPVDTLRLTCGARCRMWRSRYTRMGATVEEYRAAFQAMQLDRATAKAGWGACEICEEKIRKGRQFCPDCTRENEKMAHAEI